MHGVRFGDGFTPQDLEKERFVFKKFNTAPLDNSESDDSEDFYDERFDEFKNGNNESNLKTSEINIPFDDLRPNMTPLTEDGGVNKQILKHGTGIKIPEKSVVIMHYDAFLDNQKVPYDSTRLRNRPHKFLISEGNLVFGLELAVETMKKNEIARILISSDYAYGKMGCPPRIPGDAEILYVVEIINFYEGKDAVEYDEMTPEEQKKAPFEKIVAVFHCEHQIANDLFRSKHYKPAIARYRKMTRLLEDVSVANEEEDTARNNYLIKLYLNLCLAYCNINNSQKAIIYGKLGLGLDENNPKAMCRLGQALLLADEFTEAKHYLLKAKQYKPYQSYVQKTLIELEQKYKQHRQWENVFCKRMFGNDTLSKEVTSNSAEVRDFRNVLEEQFKKLMESDEKELAFSSGYSEWQIDIVKELANEYNFAFVEKIYNNQKIIKVVKKK